MRTSRRTFLRRLGGGAALAGASAAAAASLRRVRGPRTVHAQGLATVGQWHGPYAMPLVGIHAIVLRTGKVLLIHGDHRGRGSLVYLWNPATMSFVPKPAPANIFCCGHCSLPDGRVLVVGGHVDVHVGIKECFIFDPASETWTQAASLNAARWYPTCTALPGGRVLAVAGSDATMGGTRIPELYPPSAPGSPTWDQLPTAEKQLGVDPYYPFMFVLGSGKVFYGGPDHIGTDPPHAVLVTDTGTWADLATPVPVLNLGEENVPAVTWLAADGSQTVQVSGGRYSATSLWAQPYAWLIKFDAAGTMLSPGWRPTIQSMTYARVNHNATLLADGTVFISGGGGYSDNKNAAVKAGELFDPRTETWTVMASAQKPRLHHSTAFLLPDGRVGVTGTDLDKSLEIYAPPYLFAGPRPSIVAAPATIAYASTFAVTTNPPPANGWSAALIRPSAVTHSFNMDQRYVRLAVSQSSGSQLSIAAPASANLAPPGYYMLFVVTAAGVPSIAAWVKLQ